MGELSGSELLPDDASSRSASLRVTLCSLYCSYKHAEGVPHESSQFHGLSEAILILYSLN